MRTFDSFFTDEAIVGALIEIRLKSATKRHDFHFFRNMSLDNKDPNEWKSEVDHLLPPRSQWFRPKADVRRRLGKDAVARLSIRSATLLALQSTDSQQPWVLALRGFLANLRTRVEDPAKVPFRKPEVFTAIKKTGKADCEPKYRVLTRFSYLPDRVLLGQTAKYLTRLMDGLFLHCSHAFRVSPSCSRDQAVGLIRDYVMTNKEANVYAAECDIQKFFDCIDHDVVREAFGTAIKKLAERGHEVDLRAQTLFSMYLNLYDYFAFGLPAAERNLIEKGARCGRVDAPDLQLLRALRRGKALGRVGIPQGGPLSPLIANLVLDAADQAVLGGGADHDLLYVRYCDDMAILHTSQSRCDAALRRYITSLKRLLLPIHETSVARRYSRDFHEAKSKEPFKIGEPSSGKRAMPWISFLGYQVHWDGAIRVRKDSLDKHKHALEELVQRVLALLRRPQARVRLTGRQIEWRVALRLVSSAVGRTSLSGVTGTRQPCWMNAFRMLDRNSYSETQMHQLDRHRDRLLRKLRRAVKQLPLDEHDSEVERGKGKVLCRHQKPLFFGRPFSYCGRLIGDRGLDIQHVSTENSGNESGAYGREY